MSSPQPVQSQEDATVVERTMNANLVNLMGIGIMLLSLVVVFGLYNLLWGEWAFAQTGGSFPQLMLFLVILLGSIVVHELIHAVGYRLAGAKWSDIKFGFIWYALAPYAHCKVPLQVSGYRVAVALPGIVLGLLPTFAGLAIGDALLTFYGAIMTSAAGGDLIIMWMLRSLDGQQRVQDHPSKPGFYLLVN
jgi:hypothetical protein